MTAPRQTRHASTLGAIKLVYQKAAGTLTYVQRGGNQSKVDRNGVSLDSYIHALFGLTLRSRAKSVLMVGCGGGTLATMLTRAGLRVTVVDIDRASIKLAKDHFGLPRSVICHVGDGLKFMRTTKARFDAVIIDAFIGEKIPDQFMGDDFCSAARRCTKKSGVLFVNVCLDGKKDITADTLAARLKANAWSVRLLDQRGALRNAIVMAGHVRWLARPGLFMPPLVEAARIKRELGAMRFKKRVSSAA